MILNGRFNPILTGGGGGGGQFAPPPPLYEICDCLATAADRDTPFRDFFFLSSLTHLLIPSLRKSDHRSRGHMTFCTSAQNLPKICILRTKHMEITDFLKMHKNSVYSVFLAICTISYILKSIKIKLQKINKS